MVTEPEVHAPRDVAGDAARRHVEALRVATVARDVHTGPEMQALTHVVHAELQARRRPASDRRL